MAVFLFFIVTTVSESKLKNGMALEKMRKLHKQHPPIFNNLSKFQSDFPEKAKKPASASSAPTGFCSAIYSARFRTIVPFGTSTGHGNAHTIIA